MARETNRQEKSSRQATSGGRAGGATSPENDRSRRATPAGAGRSGSSGQASRAGARSSGAGREDEAPPTREREQPVRSGRETGGRETSTQESGRRETSGRQSESSTGLASRGGAPQVRGPGAGGTGLSRMGTTGNPFQLMQRMAEDMDRLFEQFGFGRMGLGTSPTVGSLLGPDVFRGSSGLGRTEQTLWSPQIEVRQRGDNVVIRADLPGVNRDDVHVEVENDVLTIRGERREEREEEEEGFYRSERSYGTFHRMLPLPEGVNADEVEATFKDGVLEVKLPAPRQQEQRAKRIEVR